MSLWKKQLLALTAAILILAAVMMLYLYGESREKENAVSMETEVSSEIGQVVELTPDVDYMEKYGIPEEGFLEWNIDDSVEDFLDFGYLNSLKVYTAEPHYSEDGLMAELASVFYESSDSYQVEKQDYASLSEGEWKGWGNYFFYYEDALNNFFMKGSMYCVEYIGSRSTTQKTVEKEMREGFVAEMVERLRLGFWDGEDNWMAVSQSTSGRSFTGSMSVDGVNVLEGVCGNMSSVDEDGARYEGWYSSTIEISGEEVSNMSFLYSADITGSSSLKYSYGSCEELKKVLEEAYAEKYGRGSGRVFYVTGAYIGYNVGICEDGTFLITPWLVFEVDSGAYFPDDEEWYSSSGNWYLNLSARTVSQG